MKALQTKKPDLSQVFSGKRKIWVEKCFCPVRVGFPFRKMFEGVLGSVWELPSVSYEIY